MKKAMLFVALASALGFNAAEAAELNWNGDVRFRYESQQVKKSNDAQDYARDRYRTRVRFGFDAWINDELSATVKLATGDIGNAINDTVSRNETYDGIFRPKSIYLNEAFLDYHPMSYGLDGKVNLVFGKRDVSKSLVLVNDLVYDGDITLEGATLQYGKDSSGKEKDGLVLVAGYYFLDEQFNATNKAYENDPLLTVVQAAYKGEVSDFSYLIGAGDNNFRNLRHFSGSVQALSTYPYSINVADRNVVELFGNIGGQVTETLPWKIYGQYAFNTCSKSDDSRIDNKKRKAWLAGVTLGDARQPGQWALDFNYNHIERDSVFPIFTDSDRKVGNYNSNTMGWELGATYHLVQNMTVGAKYYNYRQIEGVETGDPRLHTLQADLVVKF
jgi:opacity protein-like surface antigen